MHADSLIFIAAQGDPADDDFFSAVVARVHSHNSAQAEEEHRVGIQFLGAAQVRIFGTAVGVQRFSNQPQVRRLLGRVHVTAPTQVPAGAPLLRVARDNAADRDKPSYRNRCKTYERRSPELKAQVRTQATTRPSVHLRSLGTQQNFKMVVKTVALEADASREVRFNNYGMCLEGGIPAF